MGKDITLDEFFEGFVLDNNPEFVFPNWNYEMMAGDYHDETDKSHSVYVKKFGTKKYFLTNFWSTFTNNRIMNVQKLVNSKERYSKEVGRLRKLRDLDSVPGILFDFPEEQTLVLERLTKGKNSRFFKEMSGITSLFIDTLSEIHSKGEVHGEAILKNSVYDEINHRMKIYGFDTVFKKGVNLWKLQFLDYLTLLLSQNKYFGFDTVTDTAELMKEKLGRDFMNDAKEFIYNLPVSNLSIGRRITSAEKSNLVKTLKYL